MISKHTDNTRRAQALNANRKRDQRYLNCSQRLKIVNRAGQSMIETVMGIAFLVPILLLAVDFGIMLLAVQMNDATCRDAARAAASGAPSEADYRARAVVLATNRGAGDSLVSDISLLEPVRVDLQSQPKAQRDLETGESINPGGPLQGTAVAATEIGARTFLLHIFCGGKLPLKFRSEQVCPISYVVPPKRIGQAPVIE